MHKTIPIIVADGHFLFREGLCRLIERHPTFELTGVCDSPEDLITQLEQQCNVTVLLNYQTLEFENESSIQRFTKFFPSTRFLLICNELSHSELLSLQRMNFKAFIHPGSDEEEWLYAIEQCFWEKKYYSPRFLDLLLKRASHQAAQYSNSQLTPSELEIVKLIAEGFTTKEIAFKRHLSTHTIMTHRKNIFRKLQITNVSELMMYAIKSGWIDNIEYYI
jgi:DNA-binding NarL/FixJ family response regulator